MILRIHQRHDWPIVVCCTLTVIAHFWIFNQCRSGGENAGKREIDKEKKKDRQRKEKERQKEEEEKKARERERNKLREPEREEKERNRLRKPDRERRQNVIKILKFLLEISGCNYVLL